MKESDFQLADKAVTIFLKRHSELRFLKDDLLGAAYVAVAEHTGYSHDEVCNAIQFAIRETVTQEIQGTSCHNYRQCGPSKRVECDPEMLEDLTQQSLQEWLDCCSNEFEEAVIRLRWSGYEARQVAQQLECSIEDVESAESVVTDRYLE